MQIRISGRVLARRGMVAGFAALLTLALAGAVKSQSAAPAAPPSPADNLKPVAKWKAAAFPKYMTMDWARIAQDSTLWQLSLRNGEVFAQFQRESHAEPTRLPFTPKEKGMDFGGLLPFQVADGWLVEHDAGEWGGELWWYAPNGKKRYRISYDQTLGFFQTREGMFAFNGLNHLGVNVGSISRLSQKGKGRWKSELFVDLRGYPKEWLREPNGGFLIATSNRLLRVGQDKKIEIIVDKAFWKDLDVASLIVTPNRDIYVGMQGGVTRVRERKGQDALVEWLLPED